MRITVNRYDGEPKKALHMQEWVFYVSTDSWADINIRLTDYRECHKDNIRQRNWRTDRRWDTYDKRSNNAEPIMPQDVINEVKEKIIQAVNGIEIVV